MGGMTSGPRRVADAAAFFLVILRLAYVAFPIIAMLLRHRDQGYPI